MTDARRLGLPNIALVGKAGAGKTTGARLLVQGLDYRKLSFRNIDEDQPERLIAALIESCRLQAGGYRPLVVDDCCFPNEYWALKGEGFVLVRITAPESVRRTNLRFDDRPEILASAIEHLPVDHIVENSGTLLDLESALSAVITKERRGR